ncbi:unnamed protein product [Protopolystoma xenopodis]|uniref:Uncharacterized protein n=1 Tax=Protopolystoma xenopodis TaxID=117903 RepID=A0A448WPZ0_9PLAT|nr:unnamed protein product [Protopolystoma xenopodis]
MSANAAHLPGYSNSASGTLGHCSPSHNQRLAPLYSNQPSLHQQHLQNNHPLYSPIAPGHYATHPAPGLGQSQASGTSSADALPSIVHYHLSARQTSGYRAAGMNVHQNQSQQLLQQHQQQQAAMFQAQGPIQLHVQQQQRQQKTSGALVAARTMASVFAAAAAAANVTGVASTDDLAVPKSHLPSHPQIPQTQLAPQSGRQQAPTILIEAASEAAGSMPVPVSMSIQVPVSLNVSVPAVVPQANSSTCSNSYGQPPHQQETANVLASTLRHMFGSGTVEATASSAQELAVANHLLSGIQHSVLPAAQQQHQHYFQQVGGQLQPQKQNPPSQHPFHPQHHPQPQLQKQQHHLHLSNNQSQSLAQIPTLGSGQHQILSHQPPMNQAMAAMVAAQQVISALSAKYTIF